MGVNINATEHSSSFERARVLSAPRLLPKCDVSDEPSRFPSDGGGGGCEPPDASTHRPPQRRLFAVRGGSWPTAVQTEVVEHLATAGADVNAVDRSGATPLLWAVQNHGAGSTVATLLLRHSADPTLADRFGASAELVSDALLAPHRFDELLHANRAARPPPAASSFDDEATEVGDERDAGGSSSAERSDDACEDGQTHNNNGDWRGARASARAAPALARRLAPLADDGRCDFAVRDGAALSGEELYARYLSPGVPVLLADAAGFRDLTADEEEAPLADEAPIATAAYVANDDADGVFAVCFGTPPTLCRLFLHAYSHQRQRQKITRHPPGRR